MSLLYPLQSKVKTVCNDAWIFSEFFPNNVRPALDWNSLKMLVILQKTVAIYYPPPPYVGISTPSLLAFISPDKGELLHLGSHTRGSFTDKTFGSVVQQRDLSFKVVPQVDNACWPSSIMEMRIEGVTLCYS